MKINVSNLQLSLRARSPIYGISFLEVPRSVDVLASAILKLDLEKNFSLL